MIEHRAPTLEGLQAAVAAFRKPAAITVPDAMLGTDGGYRMPANITQEMMEADAAAAPAVVEARP